MKKLFVVLAVLLAAGCAGKSAPHSVHVEHNFKPATSIEEYAGQIKTVIEDQFYDASAYTGKVCTVRIKMDRTGMILDAKAEGGDPALCAAALAAIRSADMPPAPIYEIWHVLNNAPLDFKP